MVSNADGMFNWLRPSKSSTKCSIQFTDDPVQWKLGMLQGQMELVNRKMQKLLSKSQMPSQAQSQHQTPEKKNASSFIFAKVGSKRGSPDQPVASRTEERPIIRMRNPKGPP